MVFILASSVARLTWLIGCVISRLLLTQVNDNNRQLQATNSNQVRTLSTSRDQAVSTTDGRSGDRGLTTLCC